MESLPFTRLINNESKAHMYMAGYCLGIKTIFKDINQILPGSFLLYNNVFGYHFNAVISGISCIKSEILR